VSYAARLMMSSLAKRSSTSGVPLITSPLSLILPAVSVQTVRITGLASTPGLLALQGVHVRLQDGSSTDIYLPVDGLGDKDRRDKRRSRVMAEESKVKRVGLEARRAAGSRVNMEDGEMDKKGDDGRKWLECKVVDEQPLLWIRKTSLTHGTVMLYSGER
jgi:hypothetical protein